MLRIILISRNPKSVLFLLCVCAAFLGTAQPPKSLHFESFSINDGLSQGFVSDIVQDTEGLMWFATHDGLNKYDGYSFTIFHHEPTDPKSISSDDLTCVFEDSKQRLWVGTRTHGLDFFDRQNNQFRHFVRDSTRPSLRSNSILSIFEDKRGGLWIRTREGIDYLQVDGNLEKPILVSVQHIRLDSSFENLRGRIGVEGLLVDSRGHILITTIDRVVEVLFNGVDASYRLADRYHFPAEDSGYTPGLLEDSYNHALYLNNRNIIKFPDYNFRLPHPLTRNPRDDIKWTIDKSQHLWVAALDYIIQINTREGKKELIVPDNAEQLKILRSASVFYTDRTGVVWIGSGGYGLLKYDPATEAFHHVLKGANIYQLQETVNGAIITNNFNSFRIAQDSFAELPNYIDPTLVPSRYPKLSFAKDSLENLWFGVNASLIKYDVNTKQFVRFEIPYKEISAQPFPIYSDKANHIWAGFEQYLIKFDITSGQFSRYRYPTPQVVFDFDFMQNMYEDDDGILWLGSLNGLFSFDLKSDRMLRAYFNDPNDSSSLSNNAVFSFCADVEEPQNYLWIGTKGGGLNRLDKSTGHFVHFSTRDGLANNIIYGILPDFDGNYWLSTNKGISAFNAMTHKVRNFDVSDGLQSNEFNRYAYLRTSDGFLVFGGLNGLNYFRPQDIQSLKPPKVVLTDFRLFNKSVTIAHGAGPLKKVIGFQKELDLLYEQNVLTFQFAATDYRKKGSISYRYKMEGFDKDWISGGATHEATYTNLDPDKYTFIVQAAFENDEWGEAASVIVKIQSPWYRTWWFYALVIMTISLAVYLLYRLRLHQVRKMDTMRNRIARDLHDEVGSSISTIAIYSKIMEEQLGRVDFDNKPLITKINDFAAEIMESMNDIIWNINARNDAFESILTRMREHAFQLLEAKGYQIHFHFDQSLNRLQLGMEKRREFYLIYKEALNNVAKYSNGHNIWISLVPTGPSVVLVVRDDGVGFDPAGLKKSGNGLQNMTHRASVLKGTLQIHSSRGAGTEITLTFPSAGQ